jgi:hypothetical protein
MNDDEDENDDDSDSDNDNDNEDYDENEDEDEDEDEDMDDNGPSNKISRLSLGLMSLAIWFVNKFMSSVQCEIKLDDREDLIFLVAVSCSVLMIFQISEMKCHGSWQLPGWLFRR